MASTIPHPSRKDGALQDIYMASSNGPLEPWKQKSDGFARPQRPLRRNVFESKVNRHVCQRILWSEHHGGFAEHRHCVRAPDHNRVDPPPCKEPCRHQGGVVLLEPVQGRADAKREWHHDLCDGACGHGRRRRQLERRRRLVPRPAPEDGRRDQRPPLRAVRAVVAEEPRQDELELLAREDRHGRRQHEAHLHQRPRGRRRVVLPCVVQDQVVDERAHPLDVVEECERHGPGHCVGRDRDRGVVLPRPERRHLDPGAQRDEEPYPLERLHALPTVDREVQHLVWQHVRPDAMERVALVRPLLQIDNVLALQQLQVGGLEACHLHRDRVVLDHRHRGRELEHKRHGVTRARRHK
eukprot:2706938-Rhodomonas_salina.5